MKIDIEYDSCWQNSFLAGSNDEPLPKKEREYVATAKGLKIERKEITNNTVLGVLCRLIGDQRKLHQAKISDNYAFKDIENLISFDLPENKTEIWQEVVYVRNNKTSTSPQHSIRGVIRDDAKLFFSEHSAQLWSVLFLDFKSVLEYLIEYNVCKSTLKIVSPSQLVIRIQNIQSLDKYKFLRDRILEFSGKIKKSDKKRTDLIDKLQSSDDKKSKKIDRQLSKFSENKEKLEKERNDLSSNKDEIDLQNSIDKVIKKLTNEFPDQKYIDDDGSIKRLRIYVAALYMQLQRMENIGINTADLKSGRGKIQGFSKRDFNGIRDFLYPFSTGGKARNQGNPYKNKNGQALTKASGTLEISLDIPREKAKEIRTMIENAGVSSFYLGKKGLAYVTDIDTREVRH